MTDDDRSLTATRTVDLPPDRLFAVLADPHRHPELDGSGFVQSVDDAEVITGTGQKFRMNMSGPHMGGDYQTDNHVVGYEENRLLAWKTAPAGTEPPGWQWVWELEGEDADRTRVSLTYDWSAVTDEGLLSKGLFPLLSQEQLDASIGNLAAAAT